MADNAQEFGEMFVAIDRVGRGHAFITYDSRDSLILARPRYFSGAIRSRSSRIARPR
jgi:hypothetical protein